MGISNIKLFYLLLLFFVNCLYSQNNFEKYQFRNIQEATSKRAISCIIKDNDEFIWVGTDGAGLYRYDGVNYYGYEYTPNSSGSINSNFIYSTFVDTNNRLWIGTDEGLCYYNADLDNFSRVNIEDAFSLGIDQHITVKTILQDNNGNLILGTYGYGLIKVNLNTLKVDLIKSKLLQEHSLQIKFAVKSSKGIIYLGTDSGLLELDLECEVKQVYKDKFKREPIIDPIESLVIDSLGYIWAGTSTKGLIKIKPETDNYQFENFLITKNKILSVVQSSKDYIICGTENDGLIVVDYDGKIVKKYVYSKYDKYSLKSNSIWTLYEDNDFCLWLGYYNKGLGVFDKPNNKFSAVESLPNNENSLQASSVTAIAKDKSGNFLLSIDGGGLDVYNAKDNRIVHINENNQNYYSGLDANDIQTLYVDSNQNIWAGSWNYGIYFLKQGTNTFINYNTSNTAGLKSNRILSFSEDSKGRVWIGTFINGLHYYDNNSHSIVHYGSEFQSNNTLEEQVPNYVRKVFVDSDDILWIGTISGLYSIDLKNNPDLSITFLSNEIYQKMSRHKSAQNILSIYESNNQVIWIGTDGGGLFSYNKKDKQFLNYNNFNNFKEKSIHAIVSDNNECLWVSGRLGLSKLDFKKNKSYNFNKVDGLLVNDFNNNAVFKDVNGDLYFGSYEGLNYFNPEEINKIEKASRLYFSDFKLFNKSIKPNETDSPLTKVISKTKSLILNHTQSVFSIEYVGINYNYSKKNQYAYYLDGFEKDWNYVGNQRTANYTNIPPGNYIFKVKSSNSDGSWTSSPVELRLEILPPWWKTYKAYILFTLILFSFLVYLNNMYQSRFKAKQAIILEKEKSIQQEKLNTKKLQFFTNISHEFRTPLTLIINPLKDLLRINNLPIEVKNKLQTIYKSSDRLSKLIDELMDFNKLQFNKIVLKVKNIEIVGFTKEILSYFDEEKILRNMSMHFESSVSELYAWLDPKMFEKIIINLVANAFKFTPDGGSLFVSIKLLEGNQRLIFNNNEVQSVTITIRDTGYGIQKKDLKRIFDRFYQVSNLNKVYYGSTGIGLELVKEFIELHKGIIDVESEFGQGTTFKVTFPIGKEFFNEDQIFDEVFKNENNLKYLIKTSNKTDVIRDEVNKQELHDEDKVVVKPNTLLIVEDNVELRNYLKQELGKTYKIITAENGKKGYELAVQKLPDIIITDVIMPVMDGLELCKSIKADLKTSHIPLLMLSAKALVNDKLEGIDSGADIYLSKPFELDILKSSLAQLITSRQIIFKKFYTGIATGVRDKTTSLDNEFIQKLLSFIIENINDPQLSVDMLADRVFLSRSQLYRKIKTLTGVSVNEFIRNVRLEKAKQLIKKGDNNINEISYIVGFSSPSYFTKCYKTKYGCLPTQEKK